MWKEEFGSKVPRGVVARMARRLEVDLHAKAGFYAYKTKDDFKEEMKKVRNWYKKGRKGVKMIRHKCKRIRRTRPMKLNMLKTMSRRLVEPMRA